MFKIGDTVKVKCLFGTNAMLGLLDGLPNDELITGNIYEVKKETVQGYYLVGKNFLWLKDRFKQIDECQFQDERNYQSSSGGA